MQVNFDELAAQYSRNRRANPKVIKSLAESSGINENSKVLEVGCGTGDYIIALTELSGCSGWGIDPSEKMLSVAGDRYREVTFQAGMGESMDLPDGHFDFVFSVNVMHHLRGHQGYFQEAYRVLRPGGLICTVTSAHRIHREPFPHPAAVYFPETQDDESYPKISTLLDCMRDANFSNIQEDFISVLNQLTDITPYLEKSFGPLPGLEEEAFQRGITRMKEDLEKGPIEYESKDSMLWGAAIR